MILFTQGITAKSIDPNDSHIKASTIINGNQEYRGVTFNSGEGHDSVLKDITIRNGNARNIDEEDPNYEYGGGILCGNSSPIITHCLVMVFFIDSIIVGNSCKES